MRSCHSSAPLACVKLSKSFLSAWLRVNARETLQQPTAFPWSGCPSPLWAHFLLFSSLSVVPLQPDWPPCHSLDRAFARALPPIWNTFSRYHFVSSSCSGFTQYYLLIKAFPDQCNIAISPSFVLLHCFVILFCPVSLFCYFVLLSLYHYSQIMIVSLGCCNKEAQASYLETTDIYSPIVLERRSPKSRCQ